MRVPRSGEVADWSTKSAPALRNQHPSLIVRQPEWLQFSAECIRLSGGKGDWMGGIVGALGGDKAREGKVEVLHSSVSQLIRKWEKFKAPKRTNEV